MADELNDENVVCIEFLSIGTALQTMNKRAV